jgi:hypothetical protein
MVVVPGDDSAIPVATPPAMAATAMPPQIHQRACERRGGASVATGAGAATRASSSAGGVGASESGGAAGSVACTSAPPAPTSAAVAPDPP